MQNGLSLGCWFEHILTPVLHQGTPHEGQGADSIEHLQLTNGVHHQGPADIGLLSPSSQVRQELDLKTSPPQGIHHRGNPGRVTRHKDHTGLWSRGCECPGHCQVLRVVSAASQQHGHLWIQGEQTP